MMKESKAGIRFFILDASIEKHISYCIQPGIHLL